MIIINQYWTNPNRDLPPPPPPRKKPLLKPPSGCRGKFLPWLAKQQKSWMGRGVPHERLKYYIVNEFIEQLPKIITRKLKLIFIVILFFKKIGVGVNQFFFLSPLVWLSDIIILYAWNSLFHWSVLTMVSIGLSMILFHLKKEKCAVFVQKVVTAWTLKFKTVYLPLMILTIWDQMIG